MAKKRKNAAVSSFFTRPHTQMSHAAETAADKTHAAADTIKEKAGFTADQTKDAATEMRANTEAKMAAAKQDIRGGVEDVKDKAREMQK